MDAAGGASVLDVMKTLPQKIKAASHKNQDHHHRAKHHQDLYDPNGPLFMLWHYA